jgi:hypothetical protein
MCVIKLMPNFSNQIAIAIARIESELHVTASSHDMHLKPETVQSALDNLGDELCELVRLQP